MKQAFFLPQGLDSVEFAPSFAQAVPDEQALVPFRGHLGNTALADFFDIWLALVQERKTIPAKRDIEPRRLLRHLGHVGFTEFNDETREVVLRLAGTVLTEYAGRELSGHSIASLFDRTQGYLDRFWVPLYREARPRYDVGNLAGMGKAHLNYRALHLPLVDGEGKVRFSVFRVIISMDGGRSWE